MRRGAIGLPGRRRTMLVVLASSSLLLALGAQEDDDASGGAEVVDPALSLEFIALPADELPAELPWNLPLGLERLRDAHVAEDRVVSLGRRLFFDPILSADRTLACSTCHQPAFAFADPRPRSIGIGGQVLARNAPSLFNKALSTRVLWDGSAISLEHQAQLVIAADDEMGLALDEAELRLGEHEEYGAAFVDVFGEPPTRERIGEALAGFVRRLTYGDSPVDRFRAGEVAALDAAAKGGLWLFEGRGRCWKCHVGPNFSDEDFHNTGVGARDGEPELGRSKVTGLDDDAGKFRTPGLRALSLTAPYMHDGSLATLEEVVEYYRRGGNPNRKLSPHIAPIDLTDEEASNLVAFLEALSR